ncbi:CRISPR-associated protein Cas5 [Acidithiobacillus ferriphilus]
MLLRRNPGPSRPFPPPSAITGIIQNSTSSLF